MYKFLMTLLRGSLLALLCWPLSGMAAGPFSCYIGGKLLTPPSNLTVAYDAPANTLIWDSGNINQTIGCATINYDVGGAITIWLNPDLVIFPSNLEFYFVYNGTTYKIPNGGPILKISTPIIIPDSGFLNSQPLSYKILIRKKTLEPFSTSRIDIPKFRIFQIGSPYALYEFPYNSSYVFSATTIKTIGNTCELSAEDQSRTVKLPKVGVSAFPTAGSRAGRTYFQISASKCGSVVKTAKFVFSGTPDDTNPVLFKNLVSTGAKGIAVNFASAADQQNISANATNNTRTVNVQSGSVSLPVYVEYQSTGVVTPGVVQANIYIDMIYQ